MKILFDQNVPHNLKRFLDHHEVAAAAQLGWEQLENGDLLKAAEEACFDVFVTGDQNLSYQQNLTSRKIAIVELTKNNWPSVEPHAARIVGIIDACTPGAFFTIACPYIFTPRKRPLR